MRDPGDRFLDAVVVAVLLTFYGLFAALVVVNVGRALGWWL